VIVLGCIADDFTGATDRTDDLVRAGMRSVQTIGVRDVDDLLPPVTPQVVMRVGHVPLIGCRRPGDPAVAERVHARIDAAGARGAPIRAAMLDRAAPCVWHDTPAGAGAALEEPQETARWWPSCDPRPEPQDELGIDELRRVFGTRWQCRQRPARR